MRSENTESLTVNQPLLFYVVCKDYRCEVMWKTDVPNKNVLVTREVIKKHPNILLFFLLNREEE